MFLLWLHQMVLNWIKNAVVIKQIIQHIFVLWLPDQVVETVQWSFMSLILNDARFVKSYETWCEEGS